MTNPKLILIGGASGSGKTTLARELQQRLKDSVYISTDYYYRDRLDLGYDQRCQLNFDEPLALDFDLLYQQVSALLAGESIDCPQYDFATHALSLIHISEPTRPY